MTYFAQSGGSGRASGKVCQPNKAKFLESTTGPGVAGCRGFDPPTAQPTLMVPAQGRPYSVAANHNAAQAQLRKRGPSDCTWDIFHFSASDPAKLSPSPQAAAQQNQEVTVTRIDPSTSNQQVFATPANDTSNHLAMLNVEVKKDRHIKYYYYVLGSKDRNGAVTVPSGAPSSADISARLRDVWTRHANVSFEVIDKGRLDVRYDLDNDGKLLEGSLTSTEVAPIIAAFAAQPAPPTDGKIVFFTGTINNGGVSGSDTIGFAYTRGDFAFASNAVSGLASTTLFAHEIGHNLGAANLPNTRTTEVMVGTNVGTVCGVRKDVWDVVNQ